MNLWIQTAKQELIDVMKQVELIIINDGEVKMLAEMIILSEQVER